MEKRGWFCGNQHFEQLALSQQHPHPTFWNGASGTVTLYTYVLSRVVFFKINNNRKGGIDGKYYNN
ncbi:hypothetical protein [Paramaledivibacter caminithermalis]|uniref:hypothetical protein n=1 Tax=Paramaledivibacter caminithermalis TaxID=191027 RepID=UPI0013F4E428|nr:hypothetical protein [Paramaledivibacter caminithermalis]